MPFVPYSSGGFAKPYTGNLPSNYPLGSSSSSFALTSVRSRILDTEAAIQLGSSTRTVQKTLSDARLAGLGGKENLFLSRNNAKETYHPRRPVVGKLDISAFDRGTEAGRNCFQGTSAISSNTTYTDNWQRSKYPTYIQPRIKEIDTSDIDVSVKPKVSASSGDLKRKDDESIIRNRPVVRITSRKGREKLTSAIAFQEHNVKNIAHRLLEKYTVPEKKKRDPYEYVLTSKRPVVNGSDKQLLKSITASNIPCQCSTPTDRTLGFMESVKSETSVCSHLVTGDIHSRLNLGKEGHKGSLNYEPDDINKNNVSTRLMQSKKDISQHGKVIISSGSLTPLATTRHSDENITSKLQVIISDTSLSEALSQTGKRKPIFKEDEVVKRVDSRTGEILIDRLKRFVKKQVSENATSTRELNRQGSLENGQNIEGNGNKVSKIVIQREYVMNHEQFSQSEYACINMGCTKVSSYSKSQCKVSEHSALAGEDAPAACGKASVEYEGSEGHAVQIMSGKIEVTSHSPEKPPVIPQVQKDSGERVASKEDPNLLGKRSSKEICKIYSENKSERTSEEIHRNTSEKLAMHVKRNSLLVPEERSLSGTEYKSPDLKPLHGKSNSVSKEVKSSQETSSLESIFKNAKAALNFTSGKHVLGQDKVSEMEAANKAHVEAGPLKPKVKVLMSRNVEDNLRDGFPHESQKSPRSSGENLAPVNSFKTMLVETDGDVDKRVRVNEYLITGTISDKNKVRGEELSDKESIKKPLKSCSKERNPKVNNVSTNTPSHGNKSEWQTRKEVPEVGKHRETANDGLIKNKEKRMESHDRKSSSGERKCKTTGISFQDKDITTSLSNSKCPAKSKEKEAAREDDNHSCTQPSKPIKVSPKIPKKPRQFLPPPAAEPKNEILNALNVLKRPGKAREVSKVSLRVNQEPKPIEIKVKKVWKKPQPTLDQNQLDDKKQIFNPANRTEKLKQEGIGRIKECKNTEAVEPVEEDRSPSVQMVTGHLSHEILQNSEVPGKNLDTELRDIDGQVRPKLDENITSKTFEKTEQTGSDYTGHKDREHKERDVSLKGRGISRVTTASLYQEVPEVGTQDRATLSPSKSADSAYGSSPSTPQPNVGSPGTEDKDNKESQFKEAESSTKGTNKEESKRGSEKDVYRTLASSLKATSSVSSSSDAESGTTTTTTDDEETDTDSDFSSSEGIRPPMKTTPKYRKYIADDFHFVKVLGKGSFGKVMLAQQVGTENYFAVKCLKKDVVLEDNDVECCMIERKVLALGTRHPYLCHLFCSFQTPSHLFLVMEYLTGGDLMFHIQRAGRFDEFRACFYAAEIVSGLRFLHNQGIIYRDLKLDNILLDYEGHIRIADFGMCKLQIYVDKYADTFCGTPDYMAPEIIKGLQYNQCADWWSFGILLYEMLIGKSPFKGCDEDHLFWLICNEQPYYPRFLSREAQSILKQLLEKDSSKRLGIPYCPYGEIKLHPFFKYIDWNKIERKEVETPYKPKLRHILDTQYFDRMFTKRNAALTPIDPTILASMDQSAFEGFTYTNPHITD